MEAFTGPASGDHQGLLSSDLPSVLGGSGRAKGVWALLREGRDPVVESELGKAPKAVVAALFERVPPVVLESRAACNTTKQLLRLHDGLEVEFVIIPHPENGRSTLCVSSQVGCARACDFCATGKMGLIRSLTVDEILAQVFWAKRAVRRSKLPKLENIVFMGMGEPLNNEANVGLALKVLTDDMFGFRFKKTRVTVSTVGVSPASIRAAAELPAMLAWSVHAAEDETRRLLVPTTRHPMTELRDAFVEVLSSRPRSMQTFMVEVTMIDGINDSPAAAIALADFLLPLVSRFKVCVNLIPLNDSGHPVFRKSSISRLRAFQGVLRDRKVFSALRVTRGDEENAACGQLATEHSKKKAGS